TAFSVQSVFARRINSDLRADMRQIARQRLQALDSHGAADSLPAFRPGGQLQRVFQAETIDPSSESGIHPCRVLVSKTAGGCVVQDTEEPRYMGRGVIHELACRLRASPRPGLLLTLLLACARQNRVTSAAEC